MGQISGDPVYNVLQGEKGTCTAASVQNELAQHLPLKFISLAADVLSGNDTDISGHSISLEHEVSDRKGNFTQFNLLMQSVLMSAMNGGLAYDSKNSRYSPSLSSPASLVGKDGRSHDSVEDLLGFFTDETYKTYSTNSQNFRSILAVAQESSAAGKPAVLMYRTGLWDGHVVSFVGFDSETNTITFDDSNINGSISGCQRAKDGYASVSVEDLLVQASIEMTMPEAEELEQYEFDSTVHLGKLAVVYCLAVGLMYRKRLVGKLSDVTR